VTTALQFSGGKDSLACLYLYREQWDDLYVVWVNTGAAYPEVVETMRSWAKRLPHFLEVKSDQPAQIAKRGFPSDVVPLRYTEMGNLLGTPTPYLIQGWMACCAENIWLPLREAMRSLGVTKIIRGQRNDEARKGPVRSGEVHEGIEYVYPLENWTRDEVFAYLREVKAEVPAYYHREDTSRDCWDCTAFLDENQKRIANLSDDKRAVVLERFGMISRAVREESRWL
jgi:phosphoadenosine phosphosulfate reductase